MYISYMEGVIFFRIFLFSLLASRFLGFRLLGFLAFWPLGFLAFQLLVGLCGFWRLFGFGFSYPLLSPGFLAFAPFHWFLALAARILSIASSSLFESSLLRKLWGGAAAPPPPNPLLFRLFAEIQLHPYLNHNLFNHLWGGCCFPPPPVLFRFLAEISMQPYLNHHFLEHPISQEFAVKYDIVHNICSLYMSVCMHFFEHHRGSHPRQASHCFLYSNAPFLESLHPFESSLLRTSWGGPAAPPYSKQ